MPGMEHSLERKLVVKHTFLDFEEAPKRHRSFTDGNICEIGEPDVCSLNDEHQDQGERHTFQHRLSETVPEAYATESEAEEFQENPCTPTDNQLHDSHRTAKTESGARDIPTRELPRLDCQSTVAGRQYAVAPVVPTWTMMPIATMGMNGFPTFLVPMAPNQSHIPSATVGMQGNPTVQEQACRQDYNTVHEANFGLSSNDFFPGPDSAENFTTVMLRNLPNKYTREMLTDLLDDEGFRGLYTFVYVPIDFKTHAGLGYAFVDLASPFDARRVHQQFEGFAHWGLPTDKVCSVSWSHPQQQGCAENVKRYRDSPVMHESVPETWKPILFQAGRRVPFPRPTKKIRAPRLRV